jgi:hypothetical protein
MNTLTQFIGQFLQAFLAGAGDCNYGSVAMQVAGNGCPDTAAGACNQRTFSR